MKGSSYCIYPYSYPYPEVRLVIRSLVTETFSTPGFFKGYFIVGTRT